MRMSLNRVAHALGVEAPVRADGPLVTGFRIDSREIQPGDLFFCLPGERTDGHHHVVQAADKGAVAIVALRELPELNQRIPVLLVRGEMTVQKALGEMAAMWRREFKGRVVGVTGSAGKTTIKEMLAQICSRDGATCKNRMNWNNQIGLPMSLLSCSGEETFWVMEAGISRPGDMDDLGAVLRPDLAVLLNAGPAHLAELGDVERVAAAKAKLVKYLRPDGRALVNKDCPELWREAGAVTARTHVFSMIDSEAEFFCAAPFRVSSNKVGLRLRLQGRNMELSWPLEQSPVAQNVLAVAAAATLLGIDPEKIQEELHRGISLPGRFEVEHRGPWVLIDDSYNANPLSMDVALQRAAAIANGRPLICVLGDMLELGAAADDEHEKLGRSLAGVCSDIYYHGGLAKAVRAGIEANKAPARFVECASPEQFVDAWRTSVAARNAVNGLQGGVMLFKGSRAGKIETYLQALRTELRA